MANADTRTLKEFLHDFNEAMRRLREEREREGQVVTQGPHEHEVE